MRAEPFVGGQSRPSREWKVVRAWPGLSAEAKLAWDYLMELTLGRVDTTVEVGIAAVGEKYGAGDATRSGRRSLETLRGVGLLTIVDKAAGGIWTLHVHDPLPLRKARLLPADPQRYLFDGLEDDTGGSCAITAEQAAVAQLPPAPCKSTLTLNTSICAQSFTPQRQHVPGGSCATAADEFDAGSAIQLRLAEVRDRVQSQPAEVAALVEHIMRRVDDPRLARGFCEKVAWAVVEGAYPQVGLERILAAAEVKPSSMERGRYFIGAVRRSFADRGVPLETRKTPGEGT